MSLSLADFYDEYLESLQNLPSEIDQDMHELRCLDEEFHQLREGYKDKRRTYMKQLKADGDKAHYDASSIDPNTAKNDPSSLPLPTSFCSSSTTPMSYIPYSMIQKTYNEAIEKQDQKLELAMRMYDLVSKHIEKLDNEVMKSDSNWIIPKLKQQQKRAAADRSSGSLRKRKLSPANFNNARKKRPLLYKHMASIDGRHGMTSNSSSAILEGYDMNEPLYCYCKQVSFGDMIACDGPNCDREWFHYTCVGLVEPPEGKWFCDVCSIDDQTQESYSYADDAEA
ncbi:hypothetical protein BDF20DRAFT_912955 [Mycotypha africana]|uniref:uncharacterized protein n=1 Tax=Mycotypha africana TaxID=64632 RepID=UPI002300D995|nr:uncharacterized protein BDF20DRAFT_912955 [Mycotypha africana]KAI8979362.1 hypothetical protein BDF20DRAFT_912955 [Mycotypha africana]